MNQSTASPLSYGLAKVYSSKKEEEDELPNPPKKNENLFVMVVE